MSRVPFGLWGIDMALDKVTFYVAGCVLFALGVTMFLASSWGADPFNAMVTGIVNTVNMKFIGYGFVSGSITVLALLVWALIKKRLPIIGPLVTMTTVGYMIDFFLYIGLGKAMLVLVNPIMLAIFGLVVDAYASALIIMSGFGIRVMDLLAIGVTERFGLRFTVVKLLLECLFVTVALIFGGPVGAATFAFVLIVGLLIEPFMNMNFRWFGMKNYGIALSSSAT